MPVSNISDTEAAEILTCPIERFEDVEFIKSILTGSTNSPNNLAKFELIRIRQMVNQTRLAEAAKESAQAAKDAARSARLAVYVAFASFAVAALAFYWAAKYGG